jgi:hypothetical protein
LWRVGKILSDGRIQVPAPIAEVGVPGMVWVRPVASNEIGDAIPATYSGDALQPNALVDTLPYKGGLKIIGYAPENAERSGGVVTRQQTPISISQLDYGLLRPLNPPSMRTLVSGANYVLDGTSYLVPNIVSKDFTADIPVSDAVGIMIELDPTTNALTYTSSSAFAIDLNLAEAFADYLTKSVNGARFLVGYVKLYTGVDVTGITRNDILNSPEVLNKSSAGAVAGVSDILTFEGEVLTYQGEVLTYEG